MSFSNDDLVAVGGHTGDPGGLYLYETTDSASTVQGDGYFDSVSDRLDNDSVVIAVQDKDTSTATVDMYHVENDGAGDIELTENTLA